MTDRRMLDHQPGDDHAERPARLDAILDRLAGHGPAARWLAPDEAGDDALRAVHDAAWVAELRALEGRYAVLDEDTAASPGTALATRLAAGAAIAAVDAAIGGDRAFALVRPPGHHARPGEAMGFCLANNVAIAAAHARARGIDRVLVVDWDVHHGNGTQEIFEARDDVVVASVHRWPFWPGTGLAGEVGVGAGRGATVNVPLPEGLGDGDYAAVFDRVLAPVVDAVRPGLILVSAGFDPHRDDPIGDQRVTEDGFAALCGRVVAWADAYAGGRVALVLEGGYDLDGLARSVEACARVLAGATPPAVGGPSVVGERAIAAVLREREAALAV